MKRSLLLSTMILLGACRPSVPTITGTEWVVTSLGDHLTPVGAEGKPLTLTLDDSTHRAAGFAGCNQYSTSYLLVDSAITFGPVTATKMFCPETAEIEPVFLRTLPYLNKWRRTDSTLTLAGESGMAIQFRQGQH